MFSAIGKYFRALGYLFSGRIDRARQVLSENPAVVQATFDKIISEKVKRIHSFKEAVGSMIALSERKKSALKELYEEIAKLTKLRDGAAALAKKVVERHQGNVDSVKADPEYLKCQAAFKDFSSNLEEKSKRSSELEIEIQEAEKNIEGHKVGLQSLLREIDKIKVEKHQTVAEMLSAKEEKEIADMLSGISEDKTSQELQDLRDIRDQAKATSKVSRELAGIEVQRSEAEFLKYAESATSDNEFDKLIGLAKQAENKVTPGERVSIPEVQ